MNKSFFFLFLLGKVYALVIDTIGKMDPGYIYWPSTSWSVNPISMTSNHAGDIADITFSFTPSTTLASGIFYADFPTGFPSPSQSVSQISFIAGQDISVTVPSVPLPASEGVYGPVSIMTRASVNGNIVDLNKIFSTISIASKKPSAKANSLQVEFDSPSSVYVSSSSNLIFNFTLNQDLWVHDLLTLSVSTYFGLQSPICKSLVTFFTGSSANNADILQCTYDSKTNLLYIYGFNKDLVISLLSNTGSVEVSLKISGFTNPAASFPVSDFIWTLSIKRYATSTVVAQYTGNGPTVIYGDIQLLSWVPANIFSSAEIVSGQTLYMDISINLQHTVPKAGILFLSFSGIDIKNTVWLSDSTQTTLTGSTAYLLITPYIGGSCVLSTNSIRCSNFQSDLQPGKYTISTLTYFSGTSATINYIISMDPYQSLIDLFLTGALIKYPISTSSMILPYFSVQFAKDNAGTLLSTTNSNVILYISFQLPLSLPATTTLTLYLPLSVGIPKDFLMGASSSVKAKLLSSATTVSSYNFLLGSLISLSDPILNTRQISISLSGLAAPTTANNYIYIFLTSDAASSLPMLTLPWASTNLATKYEASLNFSVGGIIYKSTKALSILPSSLSATASLLCTDTGVDGIPLSISFTPPLAYSLDSGSKLVVEVKFDSNYPSDLGSGITGAYPAVTNVDKASFILIKDTVARLQMFGLTSVTTSSTYKFSFPVGPMTSSPTFTVMLYFLNTDRTDIQYIVMQSVISITGTSTAVPFSNVITNTMSETSVSPDVPVILSTFSMTISPYVSIGTYSSGYLGLIMPQGFSSSLSPQTSTLASDSSLIATVLYSFSSSNLAFKFTSIYFGLNSNVKVSTTTPAIIIKYFIAPTSSYTSSGNLILAGSASGGCIAKGATNPIVIQAAQMLAPSSSPDTIRAKGPGSLVTTVSISFTVSVSVSGSIEITLSTNWEVISLTVPSVIGLTGAFAISRSGVVYTITGFNTIKQSTSVTFTLENLSPPSVVGLIGHFDKITTYADAAKTKPVEQWTDNLHNTCNVIAADIKGKSSFNKISAFPSTAGAEKIYLYLEFTLAHSITETATISIYSALNYYSGTGDQSENCWASVIYSSCVIIDEVLVITLGEDYNAGQTIRVLLDVAFDLPDSAGYTKDGFAIISEFNGITVDSDSLITFTDSQRLLVDPLPYEVFTMGAIPLSINPTNEGELAVYSFRFSVNTTINPEDNILFSFPYEFDHSLGIPIEKFKWGDPKSLYLNCSSNALSTLDCKVSHWNLIVSSFTKTIPHSQVIDLNVTYIRNPAYTGTVFNDIAVYLYNSSMIKAIINSYSGVLVSASGSSLRLRSINITASKLQQTSTHTFVFYLDYTTLSIGDSLIIRFPVQYTLYREHHQSLSCSATWSDQSPTSLDRSSFAYNANSPTCFIKNSEIWWPIYESRGFKTTDLFVLVVYEVTNPEWGFAKTVPIYLGDPSVFGNFDVWGYKFEVLSYSGKYSRYMTRSYYLEHSGFLGFYSGGRSAVVNNFSPEKLTGVITLNSGSQSTDILITISSSTFNAKRLRFIPTNYEKNQAIFTFSSSLSNFLLLRGQTSLLFRISAPSSSLNSLNYIEWALEEISLDGSVSPAYISPVRTLVEVYDHELLKFQVGTISSVYLNNFSLPVAITTINPPYSDVVIALGLVDTTITGIKFNPSVLLFTQDINLLYFTIFVNNNTFNAKVGSPIYINFTISGTDSNRYNSISPVAFVVESTPESFGSQVNLLTFADLTQTTLSIRLRLDTTALVYWVFGPSDLVFPNFAELYSMITPLEEQRSSFIEKLIVDYNSHVDNTPVNGESWEDFQRRLYRKFLKKLWFDVALVEAGVTTDVFSADWLWAETKYTVWAFTDNRSGYYNNNTFTQSTLDTNNAMLVSLKFASSVNPIYAPIIWNSLALSLSVLTDMMTDGEITDNNEFSWVFNADRASALAPQTIIASFQESTMVSNLDYGNIHSTFVLSNKVLQHSSYNVPKFIKDLTLLEVTQNMAVFKVAVDSPGKVCCVAQKHEAKGVLKSEQIYVGVGINNSDVQSVCARVSNMTDYEVLIQGLMSGTQYNLSCTTCSAYPVWPDCLDTFNSLIFNTSYEVNVSDLMSFSLRIVCGLWVNIALIF